MHSFTELDEQVKRMVSLIPKWDDILRIDGRGKPIQIKSIDDQKYLLTLDYYVFVKKLGEKEYELSFCPAKETHRQSTSRNSQTIVVKKRQYIALKHKSQYQEALKERAIKHNQRPIKRFKNRVANQAKDIWGTKQNDIIVGILLLVIGLLLGKLAC